MNAYASDMPDKHSCQTGPTDTADTPEKINADTSDMPKSLLMR